jgi:serine/threonine-protein kinase RsbW
MKNNETQIALDFVSNLKFTEFCVLVFSYLKNVLKIEDDDSFKIEIALREVLNNAIIHGNKSDPEKRVHVKFRWDKSRLLVSIKDENDKKVDFDAIRRKVENIDILSFNGRGIMLMKTYMDKVRFISSESGSEIVMEKHL